MLKSSRKSFDCKKCVATSISCAKLYRKPCQQNAEGYFNFDLRLLVGSSRVIRVFHFGRRGGPHLLTGTAYLLLPEMGH